MARTLTKAQSEALFISPNLALGAHGTGELQISRVTSLTFSIDDPKEDVLQYGTLAPISQERTTPPSATLNFDYYLTGDDNERYLGFYNGGDQSILKYILDKTKDERNYFVFVAPEGADAAGLAGADGKVRAFGNGFITSYSIKGAVGGFPTASVQVQCSNVTTHGDGVAEQIPAIDVTTGLRATGITFTIPTVVGSWASQPAVIRPGDISLNLSNASGWFHNVQSGCIQSFSLTMDLGRTPLQCLGATFAKSRELNTPIKGTLQVEMYPGDTVNDSFDQIVCRTGTYNANLTFREPNCQSTGNTALGFTFKGMTIQSQNWNTTVNGLGETLTINYNILFGGTGDLTHGVFMSGINYGA